MKTNHQRRFKERKGPRADLERAYHTWSGTAQTPMSGRVIRASSTVAAEQKKAVRRDKAGAKKFVHSRERFHENAATRVAAKMGEE